MTMKLRKNKSNLQQIADLVQFAFEKKNDLTKDENFLSRYQHSDGYGIVENNKLQSYIMVNNFKARIYRKRTKIAGIGYVSSSQEARGKGNIGKLMQEVFNDLHEQGIPVANLAPFSEAFYRRYGFENTIWQKEYSFSPKALKGIKTPEGGRVLEGTWNDLRVQNGAAQIYEVPMHHTNERNTINRSYWWWNRLNTYYPDRKLMVFYDHVGLPASYMFLSNKKDRVEVPEMFSISSEGYQGLLSYLHVNYSEEKQIVITMPEESKLEYFFSEAQLLHIKIHTYMMSRIIDVAKVLRAMKLLTDGKITIEVFGDEHCPWNNGKWSLVKKGKTYSIETATATPDFSGTINSWTKVLLGNLTLNDAINLGEIKFNSKSNTQFVKGRVSFYDYF